MDLPDDADRTRRPDHPGPVLGAVSVGLLVSDPSPEAVVDQVERLRAALPAGSGAELIVLDDHAAVGRRSLFDALRDLPERVHFVPRPEGGRVTELDAMTTMATCDFLVVPSNPEVSFDSLPTALHAMWVQGADAALVKVGDGPVLTPDLEPGQAAGCLAASMGIGAARIGGRLVVVRRWVARWLLSEVDRALDPAEEVADRGRLLDLALTVVEGGPPQG